MSYDISLLLDGLILVFLGVTIFYAARLSIFLKTFRESRNGMQRLIQDLTQTIVKSEQAIETMKNHAAQTEKDIREIVGEARFLSDELRIMTDTGDGLAERLEKLADRNRELVNLMEKSGGIGHQKITRDDLKPIAPKAKRDIDEGIFEIEDFDADDLAELDSEMAEDDDRDFAALEDGTYRGEEYQPRVNTEAKSKLRSFAIFDRDHGDDDKLAAPQEKDAAMANDLKSQAEQELYEALQRKRRIRETS
jgi:hypothetical protein